MKKNKAYKLESLWALEKAICYLKFGVEYVQFENYMQVMLRRFIVCSTRLCFFVHVCIFVPMPLDTGPPNFLKETILGDPDKRPELSSKQQRKASKSHQRTIPLFCTPDSYEF